ncbi:hypothetical protein GC197_11585 [bacterium]|nr:hypothetical protein [bacterium]
MDLLYHLQNLWMAILLGVVLLILSTQWDSTTREAPSFMQRSLRLVAWMFICIGGFGWWIGISGFVAIVLIPFISMVVFGLGVQRYRVIENRGLVSVVVAGLEKGISPIASAVAYCQEANGLQQRKARRFAKSMGAGMSVVDAAHDARVKLPTETLMALELSSALGNVQQINGQAKEFTGYDTTNYNNMDAFLGGLLFVALIGTVQVALLLYTEWFLKPIITSILVGFDLSPSGYPNTWEWISWLAYINIGGLCILIPVFLLLALLIVFVQFGWLSELPWGLRWVHGPLNECRLLNVLSIVTAADLPLQSALEVIKIRFPSRRMRRIARQVYGEQRSGRDWIESLTTSGVLSHGEAALVSSAQGAGNLAWALKEVSIGKRRRHLQRIAPMMKVVVPVLVFIAAVPVLCAGIGVFLPIIDMVTNLARYAPN